MGVGGTLPPSVTTYFPPKPVASTAFFLFSFLGKGSSPGPGGEALSSEAPPLFPFPFPPLLFQVWRSCPKAGATLHDPHPAPTPRAWRVLLLDVCGLGGGKNAGLASSGTIGLLFENLLLLRALAPRIPSIGFRGFDLWLQDAAFLTLLCSKSSWAWNGAASNIRWS